MNLNLFIIGNSLASPLHTLIIPIKAYITPNEYRIVLVIPFKNGNWNNISEFIIGKNRSGPTKTIEILFKGSTLTFANYQKENNEE